MSRLGPLLLALLAACASAAPVADLATNPTETSTTAPEETTSTTSSPPVTFPPAPEVSDGPLDPRTEEGLVGLLDSILASDFDFAQTMKIVEGGDARGAWLLADMMRFFQTGPPREELVFRFTELTGAPFVPGKVDFVWAFDNLIAWDLPAWDGYAEMKAALYARVDSRWQPFFDEDVSVDWRLVTWGGVLADDRPFGDNGPCNCIPALDDPPTTSAEDGAWYADDRVVFGLVVNGKALALPKHQMEVHEMLNLTLGGRELGIPYCTLCGSPQAYFTDNVPDVDRVVLRTSGLLSRSNKMMYDLTTGSLVNTFTGTATSGPLAAAGVVLEQTTVVASTWGDWKEAHPDTQIIAEDGGTGRAYRLDPLGDRDANGPIFPVGDVDPRLGVQENVVGVVTPDGVSIAFPVEAMADAPSSFEFEGVTVNVTDGIRVFAADGTEIPTHQSFWFAWSQFHPDTLLWAGE
jgi:Protein of unknown function (DUF3179)